MRKRIFSIMDTKEKCSGILFSIFTVMFICFTVFLISTNVTVASSNKQTVAKNSENYETLKEKSEKLEQFIDQKYDELMELDGSSADYGNKFDAIMAEIENATNNQIELDEQISYYVAAKEYEIYKPYGLTYNPETNEIRLNGKRVHYFVDNHSTSDDFNGILMSDDKGNIEVVAVRDADNNLIGLKTYSLGKLPKNIQKYFLTSSNGDSSK